MESIILQLICEVCYYNSHIVFKKIVVGVVLKDSQMQNTYNNLLDFAALYKSDIFLINVSMSDLLRLSNLDLTSSAIRDISMLMLFCISKNFK